VSRTGGVSSGVKPPRVALTESPDLPGFFVERQVNNR
jgi:hypothetical protein